MSLHSCRDCRAQISRQAASCPHCGRKNPTQTDSQKFFERHPIASIVMIGVILLLFGLTNHDADSSAVAKVTPDQSAATAMPVQSAPVPAPTPIPVSAPEPVKEKIYKAIITCTTLAGAKTMPHACFIKSSPYGADTSLKITTNNQSRIYHAIEIMQMAGNNLALTVTLPEHFEIMAQNAGQYVTLGITIRDEGGKIIFEDQADQYHAIHVGN